MTVAAKPQKVTLIVITYNWPAALEQVLNSVARQTRLPDEVIVADDGSTDDTKQLVKSMAAVFPVPVRHIWQEDLGFRAARCRNLGIAASRGDYVVLIGWKEGAGKAAVQKRNKGYLAKFDKEELEEAEAEAKERRP